ncbi:MAG TPA: hypothetical protein VFW65_08735 [Pseudonocardiaceae bacterium]|nr:hypothetical protein [Pseudonocardiaceae bacterium]
MRRTKLRRPRTIVALLAALIIPIMAFAAPANAAGTHLMESSGSFRIGAPDLSDFAPVVETTAGRDLQIVGAGTGTAGQVKIEFTGTTGPDLCVAASDSGVTVVVHTCSGQLGTVWSEQMENGHRLFLSREFNMPPRYLCGLDDGTQFRMESLGQGFRCRFDLV